MVGVHWTWRLVYNTQVNLHCHAETLISSWIVATALLIYFIYLRLYKQRSINNNIIPIDFISVINEYMIEYI